MDTLVMESLHDSCVVKQYVKSVVRRKTTWAGGVSTYHHEPYISYPVHGVGLVAEDKEENTEVHCKACMHKACEEVTKAMEENKAEKRVGLELSGQGLRLWPEQSFLPREGNIGAKT